MEVFKLVLLIIGLISLAYALFQRMLGIIVYSRENRISWVLKLWNFIENIALFYTIYVLIHYYFSNT
jgi:hypothetical protein